MPLRLDFNGELLVGNIGSVDAHFQDGSTVPITIARKLERTDRSVPSVNIADDVEFCVKLGDLPGELQRKIRDDITKRQSTINYATPPFGIKLSEKTGPLLLPIKKPPQAVVVTDSYSLVIKNHHILDWHPCLRVNKRVVMNPHRPFSDYEYKLGVITGFTIT